MSHVGKIAAIVAVSLFVFAGLYFVSERVKRTETFCVSCHVADGTPLHDKKHRQFAQSPPVNMAAAHREKSTKGFHCLDCHRGRSVGLALTVAWLEVYNTGKQILVGGKEPEQLDPALMPDENCLACHATFVPSKTTFHGLAPHTWPLNVICVACHASHPEGPPDYFFLRTDRLAKACKRCHPTLSPAFLTAIPERLRNDMR